MNETLCLIQKNLLSFSELFYYIKLDDKVRVFIGITNLLEKRTK